ncbi:MAG: CotH kinase family protein, partial [Clostridia bacterium]|nr:CotH kinase family protein [Clostridia bacterium]
MRKISEAMIISLLCVAFCLSFAVGVFGATGPIVKTQSDDFGDIRPTRNTFYLPSGILPTAVRPSGGEGTYSFAFNGEKFTYTDGMTVDVTPGKTVDANGNDVYEIYVGTKRYMLYFADSVPTMYVSTSRGLNYIASDKDVRDKNTTIYIADENGGVIYDDIANGTESEIKCRGNASFGYEKKPFQIKLGKKTDLFGMGKAKTWILLANYIDCSYIRNDLAFKIADALEFDYTPESRYVNLYIDNEYYGLFELTEKVQIGSNRIEITELESENEEVNEGKDLDSLRTVTVSGDELCRDTNVKSYTYCASMTNPDDITGGYLIELDNLYAYREKCKFTTDNGNEYVIKSPECASMEQVQYIAKLFAEFEEGLYSDDGHNRIGRYYTEYADLDSLVKVYTVQEVTKNWDAYIGSVFFYKDRDADDGTVSKIFAGPVWDFDNCWGNLHRGSFFDIQTEIWAQGYGNYGGTKYKSDFGFNVM